MNKEKMLALANSFTKGTLMETLEIKYVDVGEDYLVATMPVTAKVHQPMGLLHGGATAALAESVGSAASYMFIDAENFIVKGIEISANHLKSVRSGLVTAKASVIHKGKTTHLWKIEVTDETGNLVSYSKLTNIVLPKNKQ